MSMRAMIFERPGGALRLVDVARPEPQAGQMLVRIRACGVCRTDLHIVDGELAEPKLPLILGHQIVATVEALGNGVDRFVVGDRIGVPWLGWTCGRCRYCRSERENLCDNAKFTGYQIDGGYAEYCVADQRYCFRAPEGYSDLHAAPLMCAGLISYRTLKLAGDAARIGFYGFGSAAHIIAQVARQLGHQIFAFTRPGDTEGQKFALELGAVWAGDSSMHPPEELDAALIFAAAGELVPVALRAVAKGGVVVCGGIHMSDIPSFSYDLLWGERVVRSVANLTRRDAEEFLELASRLPIKTKIQPFALEAANEALAAHRSGRLRGTAVLNMATQR